jgi:glycosyltransferase involved in cell wall biosynthesis
MAAVKPIRILLVAPSLDILGGQSVQATRLLASLRKEPSLHLDFQPINPRFPGPIAGLKRIKFVRTLATFALYVSQLGARAWRYDVLHVFSAAYTSYMLWSLPALFFAKLYSKTIILNYRDGQAEDHLRNWRTALPTLRRMDAVVSPTPYLVDVFAKFGMRIRSISNIIDNGEFKHRARGKLAPLFLHNRILEPLYNIPCTLRAFQIVQRRYPEARLIIAHEGPLRPELEELARRLELRNTEFIGRVPHPKIAGLYDAADIYLTSPDFDCMPGSILECFASGLPVVATNAGGIPYIATDNETALLIPCGDHEAMARAAIRLLEDPELVARLTRNALEECKKYEEGSVRRQWKLLYEQIANRTVKSIRAGDSTQSLPTP